MYNTRGCKYGLDAPDDERKLLSKHVEQPRNNKFSYTVASCWSFCILYLDAWNHEYQIYFFCLQRLADIAHSLLKVSPYDPDTMACRGLQHYMSDILPSTEWTNEAMRPALISILRRLDKTFNKIYKKPSIRVCVWFCV